jgi:PAS domain S-box-containing protein
MVEWSPEAVAVQRAGNIIYANAAALKLFGTTRAQALVGKPVLERVHPDFHPAVLALMKSMIHDRVTTPMAEMVLLKLDGTLIEVEIQSILTVFDGAPAIQIALHEVTERVRLGKLLQARNSELERARSMAETANRAKSDFLSNMSHELRTPLGTILGYAQLLGSGTPAPSPSQKRNIDQIVKAGWYLLELVNEVLDLATIESGKLSLSLAPMSLTSVLLECQAMLEPLATERAIGLSFPRLDAPCFVNADRIRVKQVLINLLSNAIKYNKVGGTVAMTCRVSAYERIRICIADTGQGLAPEGVAQLFQPFNRLGQERSAEAGTGIGLVMCKRLIELMGGAIGVQSTLGEGSIFWIELDLATEPLPTVKAVLQ